MSIFLYIIINTHYSLFKNFCFLAVYYPLCYPLLLYQQCPQKLSIVQCTFYINHYVYFMSKSSSLTNNMRHQGNINNTSVIVFLSQFTISSRCLYLKAFFLCVGSFLCSLCLVSNTSLKHPGRYFWENLYAVGCCCCFILTGDFYIFSLLFHGTATSPGLSRYMKTSTSPKFYPD